MELQNQSAVHFADLSDGSDNENEINLCQQCGKKCPTKSDLVDHMQIHVLKNSTGSNHGQSSSNNIYCKKCNLSLLNDFDMWEHSTFHITGLHVCHVCLRSYKSRLGYEAHIQAHRSYDAIDRYDCKNCGKNCFTIRLLESHLKFCVSPDCSVCTVCLDVVYTAIQRKCHLRAHEKEDLPSTALFRRTLFKCVDCDWDFWSRGDREFHYALRTHGVKFKCLLCMARFCIRYHLDVHMAWHKQQEPFRCKYCLNTSFASKADLEEHIKTHDPLQPYRCELCLKCFGLPSSLQLHLQEKHFSQGVNSMGPVTSNEKDLVSTLQDMGIPAEILGQSSCSSKPLTTSLISASPINSVKNNPLTKNPSSSPQVSNSSKATFPTKCSPSLSSDASSLPKPPKTYSNLTSKAQASLEPTKILTSDQFSKSPASLRHQPTILKINIRGKMTKVLLLKPGEDLDTMLKMATEAEGEKPQVVVKVDNKGKQSQPRSIMDLVQETVKVAEGASERPSTSTTEATKTQISMTSGGLNCSSLFVDIIKQFQVPSQKTGTPLLTTLSSQKFNSVSHTSVNPKPKTTSNNECSTKNAVHREISSNSQIKNAETEQVSDSQEALNASNTVASTTTSTSVQDSGTGNDGSSLNFQVPSTTRFTYGRKRPLEKSPQFVDVLPSSTGVQNLLASLGISQLGELNPTIPVSLIQNHPADDIFDSHTTKLRKSSLSSTITSENKKTEPEEKPTSEYKAFVPLIKKLFILIFGEEILSDLGYPQLSMAKILEELLWLAGYSRGQPIQNFSRNVKRLLCLTVKPRQVEKMQIHQTDIKQLVKDMIQILTDIREST